MREEELSEEIRRKEGSLTLMKRTKGFSLLKRKRK
jgi:hypothetical protein